MTGARPRLTRAPRIVGWSVLGSASIAVNTGLPAGAPTARVRL